MGSPGSFTLRLDDFSIDEFHPIFRSENPHFGHPVIVVHSEKLLGRLGLHTFRPHLTTYQDRLPRRFAPLLS